MIVKVKMFFTEVVFMLEKSNYVFLVVVPQGVSEKKIRSFCNQIT